MRYGLIGSGSAGPGCGSVRGDGVRGRRTPPIPPENLEGAYYDRGVDLYWELGVRAGTARAFRVYGRRTTDADYFLVAEVTSCAEG